MAGEEKAPWWQIHVFVAFGLLFTGNFWWIVLYLGAVAAFYVVRAAVRSFSDKNNRYRGAVRLLVFSFAGSLATGIAFALLAETSVPLENALLDRTILSVLYAIPFFPVWFVALLVFSLIRAVVRWRRGVCERRNYRRIQETAHWREAERQRATVEEKRTHGRDQQRRVDARAQCDLLYNLHAPEIANRFPRKSFDQFMAAYMNDALSAEEVEYRGRELRGIIEQHRQQVRPQKTPRTIQDLAEWYLREKQSIQALGLDKELKQEHLVALDMRYSELSQELLQGLEP